MDNAVFAAASPLIAKAEITTPINSHAHLLLFGVWDAFNQDKGATTILCAFTACSCCSLRSTEARTTVPIVSHTASEEYPLAQWEDATMELPGMDSAMLTKLHLSKEYGFLTEVGKRRLLDAYSAFCAANRRDNFQSFKQELHIAGFKEEILCPRTANGVPWWVGSGVYWIASLLLFNVPYRQLLVWKTETVHHAIIKNIA